MPKVIACGKRSNTFKRFCKAIADGENALLLVDSEKCVPSETTSPWLFLNGNKNDRWICPPRATDEHCHLMVQSMEGWLLADRETLKSFFGEGFRANGLPSNTQIEAISDAAGILAEASTKSRKGKYRKGEHSFALLALVDPEKVMNRSPWAKRFIETLRQSGNGAASL